MGELQRSKCPRGGGLFTIERCNPHLAPHCPHVRVVGHTIDRCIICVKIAYDSTTDELYSVFRLVETFPKHDISQTEVLVSYIC